MTRLFVYILLCSSLFSGIGYAQQNALGAPTPTDVDVGVEARDYSPAEIQLLQELDAARIRLERREQALELREKLVDLAEQRLSSKVDSLKELEQHLQKLLGNLSEMEEAELEQLARIYEGMKPAAAAEVLNKLDNAIVYDVFRRMKDKKTSKIMEQLSIVKARVITEMLAEEVDLPDIQGDNTP